jgi:ribose-phosphate pyrophosphokinase
MRFGKMIKINNKVVAINQYPDGTPRINIDVSKMAVHESNGYCYVIISWFYEDISEMFHLVAIKKHLEKYLVDTQLCLFMPYVPNARMDRTKHIDEVFTLKYFCNIINSLQFNAVRILDAHSNVSAGMLDNCLNLTPVKYIEYTIKTINDDNIILYFPDFSAAKRYSEILPVYKYCYGEKKRNWETGEITGLEIRNNGFDLYGKTVLMLDDIISYGGSMYWGAKTLVEFGAEKIYAYATHTENSVLDAEKSKLLELLDNGVVRGLYTTDSLYRGTHDKIFVMNLGELG